MIPLASLLRAGLKSNFGLSIIVHRLFREKKDRWYVPLVGLAAAGLVPALYGYLLLIKALFGFLQTVGQERVLLTYGILIGQFLVLLLGLYYVISAFYFSRDLEMLIPLPLRPFEIMLSKFAVILVNEYLTMAPLVLPVFIYFGILSRARAAYWVDAAVVYLLLPVIPLAIVSILSVGMMRVVNISRKKDALIIVGSLLLITLGMGIQFYAGRAAGSSINPDAVAAFFTSPNSLLSRIGAGFPPAVWATRAIAEAGSAAGVGNLLALAGVSLLLFAGILIAAEKLFFGGLIGIGEISGRGRALSRSEMSRRVASRRGPVGAIFEREWQIMNRTPIFLLNGVLTAVIVPAVIILMSKMDSSGGGQIALFLKFLTAAKSSHIILGAALFLVICGCLNGTASSTFSREGGQFWMSKVIPVSPHDQVLAKFFHSLLVALLGIAAGGLVLVFFLGIGAAVCSTAVLLALPAAVGLTAVAMIIDLARPLLDWTNPMKAIKQNLNVLFGLLADMAVLAAVWGIVTLMARAGIEGALLIIAVSVILVLISILCFRFLMKFADRRYGEIEV
jgi:ABC-2 type transport system permease protein